MGPRARAHAADGRRPGRPVRGDHRRGALLGLRRSPSRFRAPTAASAGSPPPAPPSRSRSGSRSASAPTTRSRSVPMPSPSCGRLRRQEPEDHGEARWRRVVLNGTKVITNGGIADVHVVVATVDPELGHRGQASFVVAMERLPAPGQEGVEDRHPRLLHRRGDPRGLPDSGREPARRNGQAEQEARAGSARPEGRPRTPLRPSR